MGKTFRKIDYKLALQLEMPSETKQERMAWKVKNIDRKHHQAKGSDSNKLRYTMIDVEYMDFGQKHKKEFHRYLKHIEKRNLKRAIKNYLEDFENACSV